MEDDLVDHYKFLLHLQEMCKSEFDFCVEHELLKPEDDVEFVFKLVKQIIYSLFKPAQEGPGFIVDWERAKGMEEEHLNWKNLKCSKVERWTNDSYKVTIIEGTDGF